MIQDPIALAATVAAVTAAAFWLDRNVPVLSRVGASLMVIVFGALLSNFGLVPAESPVYGAVTGPVTSLAIVWLLLGVHVSDLKKAGPRMLGAFGLAAAGTALGAFVGHLIFRAAFGEQTWRLAGTFTGTYSGGSLNFVAVGRGLEVPETLFAGAAAADNLTTGLWLAACLVLPLWLRRLYPPGPASGRGDEAAAGRPDGGRSGASKRPGAARGSGQHADAAPGPAADRDGAARPGGDGAAGEAPEESHPFFATAPVSVLRLAVLVALGFLLLVAADGIEDLVPGVPAVLWLTTLALAVGHVRPFARMEGALQLGNFALHLFFAVIGIFSRLGQILEVGIAVFFFTLVVVGVHGLVTFGVGRLARLDVETLTVASQAAVGGPSTALAVAVSRRWPTLVLPGIAAGLLGYAAGNYLGFALGHLIRGLGL